MSHPVPDSSGLPFDPGGFDLSEFLVQTVIQMTKHYAVMNLFRCQNSVSYIRYRSSASLLIRTSKGEAGNQLHDNQLPDSFSEDR
ncbi:hypothetical protein EJB05_55717, partial [Eragrostis curvula]